MAISNAFLAIFGDGYKQRFFSYFWGVRKSNVFLVIFGGAYKQQFFSYYWVGYRKRFLVIVGSSISNAFLIIFGGIQKILEKARISRKILENTKKS